MRGADLSGRGALIVVLVALALLTPGAAPAAASFGFSPGSTGFSVEITEENGEPATLAGSHPYALSIGVGFELESGTGFPEGDLRDLYLQLPRGLIENPTAVPPCSQADFNTPRSSPYEASHSGESCPDASQIGTVAVESATGTRHFGVFSLEAPPGKPARFGFSAFGAPVSFTPQVRQADGEYGLTFASENFTQLFETRRLDLTIWGVPWAVGHNGERGNCLNEVDPGTPHAQCPVDLLKQPHGRIAYLTLPSDCAAPPSFTARADSWDQPGARLPNGEPDFSDPAWRSAQFSLGSSLEGCEDLSFLALATALPLTSTASSPSGLSFTLGANHTGLVNPTGRLSSGIKRATIALPEGITINPSVGAGLGACTAAQFAAETVGSAPGSGCPNPSKIGLVTVRTPLVEETLKGSLFIARPFENPFGSAYALYFVAKSAERGFLVKVAGKLDADPLTGRLTASFENLPQLPYSELKIDFKEGQRAPLVTPAACGLYASRITLNPWIDPATSLEHTSTFVINRGILAGGACPTGGAPFAPKAVAGQLNPTAGFYSPFYLHLTRGDAEQEITSYSTRLPPGLLGRIAGIPFCPDAAIAAAKGRRGTVEAEQPSCPAASQIGRTHSGYGVGLAPAYSAGRFYLAGPYRGAPLSVVAINPAIVGPFDLGTIVIRSAIQVDPRSAQVTIDSTGSDPIPHIFAGIPLHLRDIRVHIDRPDFTVNGTDCDPFSIVSTLTGSDVPFTNPRGVTASATSLYQLSDCTSLKFAPRFGLRLSGATKRGGFPRLRATLTPRARNANLAAAIITLPPSLFLEQGHIRGVCTRVELEADACPSGSMVGRARADTPLLDEPMAGPVYLRSSSHLLPDLVAVLRGRGVRILVEGRIDSKGEGLRGTFEGLPDAPLTRFTMTMFGGRKRGLLVNSDDLCREAQVARARFVAKNDLIEVLKPRVKTPCGRGK